MHVTNMCNSKEARKLKGGTIELEERHDAEYVVVETLKQ